MTTQLHISLCPEIIPHVEPVRNECWIKPKLGSGLWTSTYRNNSSDWVETPKGMALYEPEDNWFLLEPYPAARILTIDTAADLQNLLREFAQFPAWSTRTRYPDFERLAQHYDALHLTEDGQERTRLSHPHSLYGWDSESTLWFRWCFTSCRRIPVPAQAEISHEQSA